MTTGFRLLLGAHAITLIGSQIAAFGVASTLFVRTGSASLYSLTVVATTLPFLLASPKAGRTVDRFGPKKSLQISQALGAMLAGMAALLCVVAPQFPALLIVPSALGSAIAALDFPALSVLSTKLVPQDKLGRANGLLQLAAASAQIAAPAFASQLVAGDLLLSVFAIDGASFLLALLAISRIPDLPGSAKRPEIVGPSSAQGQRSAVSIVFDQPALRQLLTLSTVSNINLGVVQVAAAALVLSLHGVSALGMVLTTSACGALAGSLLMVLVATPARPLALLGVIAIAQGVFIAALPIQTAPSATAALGALVFSTVAIWNGTSQTLWQKLVPHDEQARVFALRALIARAVVPLASGLAGLAIDRLAHATLSGATEGAATANAASRVLAITGLGAIACVVCVVAAGSLHMTRMRAGVRR